MAYNIKLKWAKKDNEEKVIRKIITKNVCFFPSGERSLTNYIEF